MTEAVSAEIVEHVSPYDFEETLARLAAAIGAAGLNVFNRIDHAANAREAGMAMPPSTVLIYGHAKGGTPIMLAAPLAALDLPLRVLVRQRDDGRISVAHRPVVSLLRAVGVIDELASRLAPAQQLLVEALAG